MMQHSLPIQEALQRLVSHFSYACREFGLTINLNKTNVIARDASQVSSVMINDYTSGARPVGCPALRFKDACNRDMNACDINPKGWETVAEDRTAWRQATRRGIERADEKKHQHAAEKRMQRKQKAALPPMSSCFVCFGCGKDCHSRIGLHSHSGRCQNLTS